jgi:diguanylate cyclase (GGDEF)-like protein
LKDPLELGKGSSHVTIQDEVRLMALSKEVSRAATVRDGYSVAIERLASTLQSPSLIRAHDGTGWRTLAASRDIEGVPPEQGVAIPIPDPRGAQRELVVFRRAEASPASRKRLEDEEWREAVGGALGTALEVVALREDRAKATARQQHLEAFSRSLVGITSAATLHGVIVESMAQAVGAEIGALAVPLQAEQTLAVTATYGYPSVVVEHVRLAPGEGVLGRVFANGAPLLVRDASGEGGYVRRRRYRSNSYVALPLMGSEGVVAVVALTDKKNAEHFDEEDVAVLSALGVPAALALGREQLRDRTQDLAHLATVDGLTGLFNRRYFETRLEQEIQRQRRQFDELALLIADLDNFKQLNDTQGHLVGDRVLREVAEILRRAVRIFDVCARYGGEEFVILMPGASAPTALRIAERIRRLVEQHFASGLRSGSPIPVTVSVGVSTASPTTSRETLIAQADSALMWAKTSGKNLVNLYQGGSA